jgi:hypothetical protein
VPSFSISLVGALITITSPNLSVNLIVLTSSSGFGSSASSSLFPSSNSITIGNNYTSTLSTTIGDLNHNEGSCNILIGYSNCTSTIAR